MTVTLTGEDLAQLAEALTTLGFWPVESGLAWLIREGARYYAADQGAWRELVAREVPDQDPLRLELQRREVLAHLLSMRARTLGREQERDALADRVDALGAEYRRLRQALFALRVQRVHGG
ncbi:MAG: hypothetical protein QN163_08635 [Armatimonadota bacterium]|nr:hypothetical protein [Armatimonadota bacterium]MDR5696564.1 hypothetical protein [Armatimonadota bacterium]